MKRILVGAITMLMTVFFFGCTDSPPLTSSDASASPLSSHTDAVGQPQDLSAPEKTLALFCEAVKTGDLELWNALYSKNFLSEYSEFDAIETRPNISARNISRFSDDQMREWGYKVDDTHRYYLMELYDGETFIGGGGGFGTHYTLVLEDGGWKIDGIGTSFA